MSLKISVKNLNLSELGKGFHREIDSVSSEITVEELISRISKELNITDPTLIEILYRGQILNRSQTFGNYINQNSNEADIYLFKSANQANKSDKPTAHEIYTLVNGLNSIFRSRTKKNYLEVFLQDNRRVNEILAPLPAIRNDPIAYGFVQNYDLIKYLNDQKRAESILQSNGNIYHAVKLIIEHIREFSKKNPVDEKFISKRSYTIDDASEDEQEQARSNNHHQQQQAARTGPAISQDHFAAVLAMLNQQQQAQRGGPSTSSQSSNVPPLQTQRPPSSATQSAPSQPQPQLPSPQLFDRNQFQSLMQQIMGQQQPQPQQQPTTPSTSAQPQQQQQQQQQQPAISSELAAKLEQMHEFGFFDDATNLRALEITEGNVEAAISLIIEGGDML